MRKASKLEVLEFINERGVISPFDLMERFGIHPWWCRSYAELA